MKEVPFSDYGNAALKLYQQVPSLAASPSKVLYFATEDQDVIKQAMSWGKTNNVQILFSNLTKQLTNPNVVHRPHDMEKSLPDHHEFEYFSYILHLHEILSCDVHVCTLPSNYCRLIDELRCTVGGNCNGWNADVSSETCASPPCIRQFGLAQYAGPIYDPQTRLW